MLSSMKLLASNAASPVSLSVFPLMLSPCRFNLVYVRFGCRHRLLHVLVREEEDAPDDYGGLSRSALICPLLVGICPDLFPVVRT
jgi:hypothetical protein